ncbi:DUF1523 family protein [Otariodibacter oris]|uniref:Uncharacterized protein DUF1523 n=1 Tax=Otariodibacter oris TaxID=1032623 RepID=A0A420XFF9_9PAST|nr:DUF1523 family protein [Otariodibacter oris]QGM81503.1 hypothetical protein A6A10_08835 [Otariodibacter oris]RKR71109.1 uncharacterized protein DUF1523 [Otariodibacter oris]
MKSILKYFLILVMLSLHIVLIGAVNYAFPSYEQTVITGMEVRRVDKDGPISKSNPEDGPVRDVYYLFTENPETKKVMTYRNEDTGWGLPFYFKFDAALTQAKAQAFANDKKLVQIKYYGWYISWLNEFRNVVSIQPVEEGQSQSMPWISYIIYAFFAFTFFLSVQFIRGWFDSSK